MAQVSEKDLEWIWALMMWPDASIEGHPTYLVVTSMVGKPSTLLFFFSATTDFRTESLSTLGVSPVSTRTKRMARISRRNASTTTSTLEEVNEVNKLLSRLGMEFRDFDMAKNIIWLGWG
jgi:hypothetical protein